MEKALVEATDEPGGGVATVVIKKGATVTQAQVRQAVKKHKFKVSRFEN